MSFMILWFCTIEIYEIIKVFLFFKSIPPLQYSFFWHSTNIKLIYHQLCLWDAKCICAYIREKIHYLFIKIEFLLYIIYIFISLLCNVVKCECWLWYQSYQSTEHDWIKFRIRFFINKEHKWVKRTGNSSHNMHVEKYEINWISPQVYNNFKLYKNWH